MRNIFFAILFLCLSPVILLAGDKEDQQLIETLEKARAKDAAEAQEAKKRNEAQNADLKNSREQAKVERKKALAALGKEAEAGNVDAQYKLATMWDDRNADCEDPWGLINDESRDLQEKQALTWYQKAADQGHLKAQECLANIYASGRGVPEDPSMAFIWFSLSGQEQDAMIYAGRLSTEELKAAINKKKKISAQMESKNAGKKNH